MALEVQPFFEPQSSTWTYLLADPESGKAAVIDPVWVYDNITGRADRYFADRILDFAGKAGWTVTWVLETHAHADHLSSGGLIAGETGAKLAIGRGICTVQKAFRRVHNLDTLATDGSQFDRLLSEGDRIALGGLAIRVMETPGHTRDSITYLVDDAAFIGDTLFPPGYGTARCDFPGGDPGLLYDSIQKIHDLPSRTRLYFCHDYPDEGCDPVSMVTVDESRRSNVHAREGVARDEFVRMRNDRDAGLELPRLILPSLQVNILGGRAPQPEENGFSYLKIPFNTSIPDLLGDV